MKKNKECISFDTESDAPDSNYDKKHIIAIAENYEGPLPHPSILSKYEELKPGAVELIFEEFHKNSEHLRNVELIEAKGNVDNIARGQWMAFVLALILLLILGLAIYFDLPWVAALIVIVSGVGKIAQVLGKKH